MTHAELRAARTAKAQAFAKLYKSGKTLQEIGDMFAITRERVRQLLVIAGVTHADGGAHKRASKNALMLARSKFEKRQAKNSTVVDALGCSVGAAVEINGGLHVWNRGAPSRAYLQQRKSAAWRGIEWKFTFPEWWQLWQASGKWNQRGRPGYCMARWGDSGAYEPSNVYICTIGENFSHSYLVHPWHERFKKTPRAEFELNDIETKVIAARERGLTYSQIAADLGVSVGSVNWTIGHARKKLALKDSILPASKKFAIEEMRHVAT